MATTPRTRRAAVRNSAANQATPTGPAGATAPVTTTTSTPANPGWFKRNWGGLAAGVGAALLITVLVWAPWRSSLVVPYAANGGGTPAAAQSGTANELAILKQVGESKLGPGPQDVKFNGVRLVQSTKDIPVPPGCTMRTVRFSQGGKLWDAHRVEALPGTSAEC